LIQAQWEKEIQVTENFNLTKIRADFFDFNYPENHFDLVYFDAFGFRVQPELWTEKLFEKLYKSLKPDGIFTTYSAKGSVRRSLISLGFKAEKKPGPPGKREMLVAKK
jgi:tRNA U34 5-methylaminomethyl-2-thiouridine-forming methyltransferase MnmC